MNMQDNELDELFRSRLSGMEIEPSAHIWDNIAANIDTKKRSWAPVIRIAAAVLILLTAGLWFLMDKPVKVEQQIATKTPVKGHSFITKDQPKGVEKQRVNANIGSLAITPRSSQVAATHTGRPRSHKVDANDKPADHVAPNSVVENTIESQPVLAAVNDRPVLKPVVPDGQIAIHSIDTTPAALKPITTAPVVMAANHPAQKKRHGIHSLGDLINVVVAKVDKREDKLIEFTETDEDSNVTGFNLGIVRVKKENK